MGIKTSVHGQGDFLVENYYPRSHRATKLTGQKNTRIYEMLKLSGSVGCTARELEQHFHWKAGTASPRLSELKALGLASKTNARRQGSTVFLLSEIYRCTSI